MPTTHGPVPYVFGHCACGYTTLFHFYGARSDRLVQIVRLPCPKCSKVMVFRFTRLEHLDDGEYYRSEQLDHDPEAELGAVVDGRYR